MRLISFKWLYVNLKLAFSIDLTENLSLISKLEVLMNEINRTLYYKSNLKF